MLLGNGSLRSIARAVGVEHHTVMKIAKGNHWSSL
jgi:transposase-like protein